MERARRGWEVGSAGRFGGKGEPGACPHTAAEAAPLPFLPRAFLWQRVRAEAATGDLEGLVGESLPRAERGILLAVRSTALLAMVVGLSREHGRCMRALGLTQKSAGGLAVGGGRSYPLPTAGPAQFFCAPARGAEPSPFRPGPRTRW